MTMMVEGERSQLTETTLEKDLGILFSSDLKPSDHVAKAVLLANQMLGLFRRTFTHMDIPLMRQLFITMVRPHLEYSNAVWHPTMIEAVQHRATKMVPGLAKFRGDAIGAFKYLNGHYSVDVASLLIRHKLKGMTTRGHSLKLQKGECHSNVR
jgi:hypothetical protein